jgi:hypothetical protein
MQRSLVHTCRVRQAAEADLPGLAAWWDQVRRTAPPQLAGLWFGIVKLARPVAGWHLYVAGTDSFDAEDGTAEWAVPDYAWLPAGRYHPLPELGTLPVDDALGHVARLLRSIRPWLDVEVQGVAVWVRRRRLRSPSPARRIGARLVSIASGFLGPVSPGPGLPLSQSCAQRRRSRLGRAASFGHVVPQLTNPPLRMRCTTGSLCPGCWELSASVR